MLKGSATAFGADFYTEIFKAVYAGTGWTCISLGAVCFAILLSIELKGTTTENVDAAKLDSSQKVVSIEVPSNSTYKVIEDIKEDTAVTEENNSVEKDKAKLLLNEGIITEEEYNALLGKLY